ncbi:type IX secretion system protein PorD [Mucilaginibacter myungsuensis]|uniref:DUF4835 family protein n=1 Tax=Mucilaginibacter myungsuensis TaxID=649104 RepID=A0A929L7F2_9SPHI|nr:DUF4835 family protein [Mucilaginibacter myungsuensis]MBE9664561.1 DUF4835 family protein [Mucilaginibacter myungsuensis]MDN3601089.1 DUF4835 family protein [Mucilaginibacter myungsuensis]
MKKLSLYLILFCCSVAVRAQDLNARVQILTPKIQTTNKRIFQTLETAMREFLNGRKWAQDPIKLEERITCNFILNVTAWDGNSNFSGELQVQSQRPIYNSSYTTTLLSTNDKDFDFTYTEGQTIDYTDQNFQNNLSAVMAYYAYIIVGLDYDSFSKFGGSPYFTQALNIVTNAQSASFKGWKAFDSNTNRYWLAENLNNKIYTNLRAFIYDYHRTGLDAMAENSAQGRKVISGILPSLVGLDRQRIGAMWPTLFFSAKSDELVNIFNFAEVADKGQALNILTIADPANGLKYQKLSY